MLAIGAMLLLGFTLVFREGAAFDAIAYARNFVLLALPGMFVIASFAVLLDILVGKWRGALVAVGIFGYIFLLSWTDSGTASGQARAIDIDFGGTYRPSRPSSAIRSVPNARVSGGLEYEDHPGKPIYWRGLAPTSETVDGARDRRCRSRRCSDFWPSHSIVAEQGRTLKARRPRTAACGHLCIDSVNGPGCASARFCRKSCVRTPVSARKNLILAIASAGLFVLAIVGAQHGHHWVVAGAMSCRSFGSAHSTTRCALVRWMRRWVTDRWYCGRLDCEGRDVVAVVLLPLVGLLFGNPQDPMVWAPRRRTAREIAWLAAITWVFRAELLGLGFVALLWYVVAFNDVPPIDYAGLWGVSVDRDASRRRRRRTRRCIAVLLRRRA